MLSSSMTPPEFLHFFIGPLPLYRFMICPPLSCRWSSFWTLWRCRWMSPLISFDNFTKSLTDVPMYSASLIMSGCRIPIQSPRPPNPCILEILAGDIPLLFPTGKSLHKPHMEPTRPSQESPIRARLSPLNAPNAPVLMLLEYRAVQNL